MAGRKQETYDERRSQIIDGALEVFSTKGFSAASNRDIARAAGINSPGLIYHYFASKEDLLMSAIERHAAPMQMQLNRRALPCCLWSRPLRSLGVDILGPCQSRRLRPACEY